VALQTCHSALKGSKKAYWPCANNSYVCFDGLLFGQNAAFNSVSV